MKVRLKSGVKKNTSSFFYLSAYEGLPPLKSGCLWLLAIPAFVLLWSVRDMSDTGDSLHWICITPFGSPNAREPLTSILMQISWRCAWFLGGDWGCLGFLRASGTGIAVLSCLCGAIAFPLSVRLASRLFPSIISRATFLALLWGSFGITGVFVGRIEVYAPLHLAVLAAVFAWQKDKPRSAGWLFGLAMACHGSAVAFIPGWLAIRYSQYKVRGLRDWLRETARVSCPYLIVLVGQALFLFPGEVMGFIRFVKDETIGRFAGTGGDSLFHIQHFESLASIAWTNNAVSFGLGVIGVVYFIRKRNSPGRYFSFLFLSALAAALLWYPELGSEDWDLFGVLWQPACILGALFLDSRKKSRIIIGAVRVGIILFCAIHLSGNVWERHNSTGALPAFVGGEAGRQSSALSMDLSVKQSAGVSTIYAALTNRGKPLRCDIYVAAEDNADALQRALFYRGVWQPFPVAIAVDREIPTGAFAAAPVAVFDPSSGKENDFLHFFTGRRPVIILVVAQHPSGTLVAIESRTLDLQRQR